ncbi:MAG TPA: P-loop NTPase [Candidatus Limnocylindrales bacterium]|nr:P-loop NTPase [Candidatus Limnocylindrales bacterium]
MDALFAAVAKASPRPKPAVRMFERPAPAGNVVAVCSGKGGVGKSTVALNLAASLAGEGLGVGLLDADVYGPDIPLMVGLKRTKPATSWQLARAGGLGHTPLEPVEAHGVQLMSSGFIISEDQALTWNAELIGLLLNQLIWSTLWGRLDYLIIDLPPGTSDVVQDIFRVLPDAMAAIVVTPQDVAHLDNRRVVGALRRSGIRLLGGIENMNGLRCPSCDAHIDLFPPTAPERSIWAGGLPLLGSVPWSATLGPPIAEPVVLTAPESDRGNALREVARNLRAAVEDQ